MRKEKESEKLKLLHKNNLYFEENLKANMT